MKKIMTIFLFIFNFSLSSQFSIKADEIDKALTFYKEFYDFNGSIIVSRNGKVLFHKGYGYENFESGIKTKPDTVYHIRSITKGMTNVLIADPLKTNRLKLEDKISKYLPEIEGEIGNRVTIKQLLTHQGGIPVIDMSFDSKTTKIGYLKQLSSMKLLFEPGTKERYHDFNYFILGVIIERLNGRDLASIYRETIFSPLGMDSAGLADGESMVRNMAVPYYVNQPDHGDSLKHVFPRTTEVGYSFGGVYATIADLHKWIIARHSDRFSLKKIDGFEDNKKRHHDTPFGESPLIAKFNGIQRKVLTGDGSGAGFRSLYYYFPEEKICIVMANNSYHFKEVSGGMPFFDSIPYVIAQLIFEGKATLHKTPVGRKTIMEIKKGENPDTLINNYHSYKSQTDKYQLDPKQLNRVGYFYLQKNDMKNALKIFSLNLKEYPGNWIAFDGLGEYYFRTGNREKAVEYFKESIKRNPNKWREERKMHKKRKNIVEILNWKRM